MTRLSWRTLFAATFILASCKNPLGGEGDLSQVDASHIPLLGAVNVQWTVPFTPGNEAHFEFSDPTAVEFTPDGSLRLKTAAQTDDNQNAFSEASAAGMIWDPHLNSLRLESETNIFELSPSWTPQWSNLVGYWKLNGSGALSTGAPITAAIGTDAVVSNLNGTGILYTQGQLSESLQFDGIDDRACSPSDPNLAFGTGDFSIALWLKTSKVSAYQNLVARDNAASGAGIDIATSITTGVLRSWIGGTFLDGKTRITTGQWTHVAVIRASGVMKQYVNGTLDTSKNAPGSITANSSLCFGRYFNGNYPFEGLLDEIAVWKKALTPEEVHDIFSRQSSKFSGELTSRVMDGFSTLPWNSLTPITNLPFYKELPLTSESNTPNSYPALAPQLMNAIAAIWRLDEKDGVAPRDSINNIEQGSIHGGVLQQAYGKLGYSYDFDGSSAYLDFGNPAGANIGLSDWTVSAWFKTSSPSKQTIIAKSRYGVGVGRWAMGQGFGATSGTMSFLLAKSDGTGSVIEAPGKYHDGHWHLMTASIKRNQAITIYIDGKAVTSADTSTLSAVDLTSSYNLLIGAYNDSGGIAPQPGYYFKGSLDEVAIWKRALSAEEVLQLYRRGGNRIKYQVRSCSASDCSDHSLSSGQGWKGPDNTSTSFFSELNNNSSPQNMAGRVNSSGLIINFSDYQNPIVSINPNRYFQYKVIFESDDVNTLCSYDSVARACSPELRSMQVGPDHYITNEQVITSKASLSKDFTIFSRDGFTVSTDGTCDSRIKYSLSTNGSDYYYWNGDSWLLSDGSSTMANSAATLRSHIHTFTEKAGAGPLSVRIFIQSAGLDACSIRQINFFGLKVKN